MDASGSRYGPVVGSCEDDNKLSGPIKWGQSLTSFATISF